MLTPQTGGAYYQHFIDRGWSKLIQAWDLINEDPEVKILVSPSYLKHPNVEQLWDRFGLKVYQLPLEARGRELTKLNLCRTVWFMSKLASPYTLKR